MNLLRSVIKKVIAHSKSYNELFKLLLTKEFNSDTPYIIKLCGKEYLEKPAVLPLGVRPLLLNPDEGPHALPIIKEFDNEKPPQHKLEYSIQKDFKAETFFAGVHDRPFVTLPIRLSRKRDEVRPVTFLVDTGSPFTHLSEDTILRLTGKVRNPNTLVTPPNLIIGKDIQIDMQISHDPFIEFNLLGTNVIYRSKLLLDYDKKIFQITFD